MAVSDVEAALEFLRKHGFSEAESALKEEAMNKCDVGYFDFEKFVFPMVPPPPPLRIPVNFRRSGPVDGGDGSRSSSASSDDEFVSLGSSTSAGCSSEFTNPYGIRSTSRNSDSSSDRLSQFGTARDYHDFDLPNDFPFYDKREDGNFTTPCFNGPDLFFCPTEDKFVMTSERELDVENELVLDDPFRFQKNDETVTDQFCSVPFGKWGVGVEEFDRHNSAEISFLSSKEVELNDFPSNIIRDTTADCVGEFKSQPDFSFAIDQKNSSNVNHRRERQELNEGTNETKTTNDVLVYESEQEYEVFNLRIIHRKNRTGFEENKDLPVVLNSVIAGRYYVTEYIGSAAFSKVVQAHDLHMGIDVCLKIIKNDKDFFDQSLDEIKLLKLVNKHDPADERHILRLYDYFYHQEHLFIVCELLGANLYEFQKFNRESGEEPYFTLRRLQVITRQCLEALEYLHHLGIIHCDLKPENILLKSYNRSEIKVIDLGSSCFFSDNLCLYVQSRSYRAPEVMLGLSYDQKIDMWSLGCILAELCSGQVLFPNEAVVLILARMIGMFGPFDSEMRLKGQDTHKYFTKEHDLFYVNEETDQLEYIIPEKLSLDHHLGVSDVGFIHFVRNLLQINPKKRPTAKEALQHPWLKYG